MKGEGLPRIKRYFPVSHNIFPEDDPEIQELIEKFGKDFIWVWLKILSISDQDEGKVKGKFGPLCRSLARTWGSSHPKVVDKCERLVRYIESNFGWFTIEVWGLDVRNYKPYHLRREKNKSQ